MIPMFPKGYDKDKWYMTKDVMPDKSLEGWPHGLLLRIEDDKTGEKKFHNRRVRYNQRQMV